MKMTTLYICQCPHRLPAKIWTATSEIEALDLLNSPPATDLRDAAADDMRDAYVTSDPLDLFFWINHADAPRETNARAAYFRNMEIKLDIEDLARPTADDRMTALDGRFSWSPEDEEWTLDNLPPVEAASLFHAISEAELLLRTRDRLVQSDV